MDPKLITPGKILERDSRDSLNVQGEFSYESTLPRDNSAGTGSTTTDIATNSKDSLSVQGEVTYESTLSPEESADIQSTTPDFATKEKQEARAFLRERFLRAVSGVVGKDAEFQMYENTKVSAKFGGSDMDVMHFYVTKLKTPMGTIAEGILRTNDIIHVHIPDINASPT